VEAPATKRLRQQLRSPLESNIELPAVIIKMISEDTGASDGAKLDEMMEASSVASTSGTHGTNQVEKLPTTG